MDATLSLLGMAGAAFGAATILPFQSEIVFVGLQRAGTVPLGVLVFVASVANTLGSVVNFWMGRGIERFRDRRWFPVTERQLDRAQRWYGRYGYWSLLLSWAPLGDAITIVAGILRTPFWIFCAIVALAKTVRYAAVAALAAGLI